MPEKMDNDRLSRAIIALGELVARLRGPGGCPWDARQTDSTIKLYLLEEAYEVLEAIEELSPPEVCLELGDLLFQILFLARMAAERGEFDFIEVVERVTDKMIHRHPHVFGRTRVAGADDVAAIWAEIKEKEKNDSGKRTSSLQSVPANLPALLRAHRLGERMARMDPELFNENGMWDGVEKKIDKLRSAIAREEKEKIAEEIGGLLFSLTNLARCHGFNAEDLLRIANRRFLNRFEDTERKLKS